MSCYKEKLVAEAEDSWGANRERNVRRWNPLRSNDSEDVTMDCVCNIIL
jgi:hypothetical protein